MSNDDKVVYTVYIAATPDAAWQAITDPDMTARFFGGRRFISDWKVGAPLQVFMADGVLDVLGEVLEADPGRLLSVTWHVEWIEEMRKLPPSRLTFRIEPVGEEAVRFTVEHGNHEAPQNPEFFEGGRKGWPIIISQLKTLLETGHTIPGLAL